MWHYGLVKDTDCGLNEWNLITTMFRIALESTWPPQGLSAPWGAEIWTEPLTSVLWWAVESMMVLLHAIYSLSWCGIRITIQISIANILHKVAAHNYLRETVFSLRIWHFLVWSRTSLPVIKQLTPVQCPQLSITGTYLETDKSSLHPKTYFFNIHLNIIIIIIINIPTDLSHPVISTKILHAILISSVYARWYFNLLEINPTNIFYLKYIFFEFTFI
jgi:hypothetical protein